jgi:signal peptidase I
VNGQVASYTSLGAEDARRAGLDAKGGGLLRECVLGRAHPVMGLREGPGGDSPPVAVPSGQYFLMGDHRDSSFDSRYWGLAERRRIVGRAVAIVASIDVENGYRPRWQRFFTALQ